MAATMTPPVAAPAFLARAGWADAHILPLAGDASFRRYFRVATGDRRAILMDAPPPHEDVRPFIAVADYLRSVDLAAPAILAHDVAAGLVLLEDFGDVRMREAVDADRSIERDTYAEVVDLLIALHARPPADVPDYSRLELLREAGLFLDWYCPAVGLEVDAQGYRAAWNAVLDRVIDPSRVTVLRDCHAENIMLRPGRTGLERLGLLDFQDALVGHPAYDLVSLLQDARRTVPAALETEMLGRYRMRTASPESFDAAYAILGAQRNAKIIGIFSRLWKRDGKPRYVEFLPRVWEYLERDLAHPSLAEIADWFARNVPADRRGDFDHAVS